MNLWMITGDKAETAVAIGKQDTLHNHRTLSFVYTESVQLTVVYSLTL